jgi:hypothetical protein
VHVCERGCRSLHAWGLPHETRAPSRCCTTARLGRPAVITAPRSTRRSPCRYRRCPPA